MYTKSYDGSYNNIIMFYRKCFERRSIGELYYARNVLFEDNRKHHSKKLMRLRLSRHNLILTFNGINASQCWNDT